MTEVVVKQNNVLISFLLLLFVNFCPLIIPSIVPVPVQLLISSSACVYIGCSIASKVVKNSDGTIVKGQKSADEQTVTKQDALRFPITASVFLLALYLLYKYVSPKLLNIILTFQFCFFTAIAMGNLISPYLPFSESSKKVFWSRKSPKLLKQYLDFPDIVLSTANILTSILCLIPIIIYYITKYWMLNNFFGILFSILAIRGMNLGSFYVGFLLLWLLFFYDIFWVYGTDVMVTVAKNLDIPIKLLFPYYNAEGQWKFSMLGLGDIVLPGIFVSICLKYDIDKSLKQVVKNVSDIKLSYFNTCFIGYILGIVETFAALKIYNHAQPALLFLVPMCTIPILIKSLISGQYQELKDYDSDKKQKKQQQKKQQKTQ